MGEYSKKEIAVIDYLIESVNFQVFCIEQEVRDKGRLDYSLCSDYDEKQIVTKKNIKKFKKKIDKCDPAIAVFLIEFTSPFNKSTDIYELRDILTRNFLAENYAELIECLSNQNNADLHKYEFEGVIESNGYDYKLLKKFIEGICDVNHYLLYKSFLDIPRNENISYDHIIEKLNNAFFRLESFANGSIKEYYHFDFNTAFTELFYFTRKVDNFTYDNCKRIGQYWDLTEQIRIDYDKSDFENLKAFENKTFCNDCNVLTSISWDRIQEFVNFKTPDEIEEQNKKVSIADLMKPRVAINLNVKKNKKQDTANNHSPYILSAVHPIEKKIKSLVITKNEFIRKITKAEILAEDTFEVSVNQDLFLIEKQKINEEHHNKLILKYYTDTINSYNSATNLYKASNDQFDFLKNNSKNTLTEEDRVDFIATVLFGYLTDLDDENNEQEVASKEILSQLKNIDTLIYETKLLELKAVVIKKCINDTENEFKENDNILIENKDISVEEPENDHLKSTIEDYLEEFADDIKHDGYKILVDALYQYFSNNEFPVLKSKINFKTINRKRLGWALKKLYKSERRESLPIEYFRFAQENINLFENEIIETENFNKSKFYKMFTTNPAK